jgi:ABC-type transport system involved in cytochrome c biogenesis permease subunit
VVVFHQIAAALYLAAGLVALLGITLSVPRMSRYAAVGLGLGAIVQAVAFGAMHAGESTPPLTNLSMAVSLMAWMAVLFLLLLRWRLRLPALAAVVGPLAFLAVFIAAGNLGPTEQTAVTESGSVPHAHVMLGGAGLALLGVAGVAGGFYLVEHRRLKSKRPIVRTFRLPSLEALDQVNRVSLAVGFPLLTLGVITGMAWLLRFHGSAWQGSSHETWTAVAWGLYAGLAAARFAGNQGARQAAASAVVGFAFLLFAVVGVGILT